MRIWRTLVRPDSGKLLDSLETEANIEVGRKQFAEARALFDEVLRARLAALGPNDLSIASVEVNLGLLEYRRSELRCCDWPLGARRPHQLGRRYAQLDDLQQPWHRPRRARPAARRRGRLHDRARDGHP